MGASLKAPDGTPINEQVGNYVLRRYLTQGGMAALFLAHHVDARDVVVAKRVLPQFSRDLSFTRMFTREAHLASLLRHPNIVEVYDSGGLETEGCYFVMEYIHGVDLSHFLSVLRDRNLTMPLDHALTIALAMCAGLNHAHNMLGPDGQPLEIVHRDVSPSNVMVAFSGKVKVMDFGVAKALALTSFTEAGTRKGKLSYMAPEQARAAVLDRRADVFAIGAVLYELTTMRRLFTGGNELAVIHQLMYEERTRPSTVVPGYPGRLEQIVMCAVEHKAEDRFATAAEFAEAIRTFATNAGLTLSNDALGAFLREQITAPPHPAQDPDFFSGDLEGAMPEAATAVEPVGPHDTGIDQYSDGGGLQTDASPLRARAGSFPATTQPYAATTRRVHPQDVVSSVDPAGLSAPARLGLLGAALLTLAASGGVAFLLTRGNDPAPAGSSTAPEVESAVADPKRDPGPKVEVPVEDPPGPGDPFELPVADPHAADPIVVPGIAPAVDSPSDPATDPPSETSGSDARKAKKKKKKAVASEAPDPPQDPGKKPVVPASEPDSAPTKKQKKKVNPTDTLLPIVGQ